MSSELSAVRSFAARRDQVADALGTVLSDFEPTVDAASTYVVTGIGASEGPARLYAAVLRSQLRLQAEFVPLSAFYDAAPDFGAQALCVFSQGLSPNAQIALRRAGAFDEVRLITSVRREHATDDQRACLQRAERDGVAVSWVPCPDERGSLVRVVGPATATLAALLMARARLDGSGAGSPLDLELLRRLPSAVRAAEETALVALAADADRVLGRPVAFVTAGHCLELHQGLRNKWLETLPSPEPPLWDVLSFVHGPLQEIHDREFTLVTLEREGQPRQKELFDRLERLLAPQRHALVRLRARLGGLASVLEHDALVNELTLRALRVTPRDTSSWVGSALDAPLYRIDGAT